MLTISNIHDLHNSVTLISILLKIFLIKTFFKSKIDRILGTEV